MPLYKRTTRSGNILEQEVYNIAPNTKKLRGAEPNPLNIRTDEEKEEYNRKQSLKRFIRIVNTNFNPTSYYVTLTFDDEHLPPDFKSARRVLDNYTRRLQYSFPNLVMVAVMGRGKRSERIHFHLIVSGVDKEAISNKWTQGKVVRVDQLRKHNIYNGVDHGQDYTALAIYLFNHWTKEQGGKRWKQTKTVQQPIKERPKMIRRRYSLDKPPITPKDYMLVEKKESEHYTGGYLYFKYVKIPDESPPLKE